MHIVSYKKNVGHVCSTQGGFISIPQISLEKLRLLVAVSWPVASSLGCSAA